MRFRRSIVVAIFMLCGAGLSQNPPASDVQSRTEKSSTKETIPAQHWLELANLFTAEVEQDATQLSTNNGAVAEAEMSRLWKDVDRVRSRQFLDRAIEQVTRIPDNETKEQQEERIRAGSTVLQIAIPMVSSDEAKSISAALTRNVSDPRETYMAKMREQQAFAAAVHSEIDHDNVTHATEMMAQGLKDGKSLPSLGRLRHKDPAAADRVFRETLKSLPDINYDPPTISSLMFDAFPLATVEGVKSAPDELKNAFLQTMMEAILHTPLNETDKGNECMNAQFAIMFLQGKFPPQQWTAIQAVVDDCLPKRGKEPPSAGFKPRIDCLKLGAKECLRLADSESNPNEGMNLRIEAMSAAAAEKNPELAISIYKSLPEQQRQKEPSLVWNLEDSYEQLGHKYLKNNDRPAFDAMLRDAPDELRPYLQLTFAGEMLEKGDRTEALALLAGARSAARSGTHNPHLYRQILNLYVRFLPDQVNAVMTEFVDGINRIGYPKDEREARRLLLSPMILPWILPAKVLDLDPSFLSASADSLQVPEWRTCFRLGLLRTALLRYMQALAAAQRVTPQKFGTAK